MQCCDNLVFNTRKYLQFPQSVRPIIPEEQHQRFRDVFKSDKAARLYVSDGLSQPQRDIQQVGGDHTCSDTIGQHEPQIFNQVSNKGLRKRQAEHRHGLHDDGTLWAVVVIGDVSDVRKYSAKKNCRSTGQPVNETSEIKEVDIQTERSDQEVGDDTHGTAQNGHDEGPLAAHVIGIGPPEEG